MDDPKPIELNIEISASDASVKDTDQMKSELLSELKKLYVESIKWVRRRRTPKGDPTRGIGTLTIAVLPSVIPSVIGIVQAWAMRGQGRTVKFKGKGIEFEGSPEELQKLLSILEKGHHRLAGDSTTDAPPPKKR